ncbi:MAG: short-chain fatty acyl-CoA regulator family protein [Pseudomonadota bacterium]
MARSLAGTRIRERRRTIGLTQAALARKAGISASYLNLIEHNRRGIAGRTLGAVAKALDVAPEALLQGPEVTLIGDLREAAGELGEQAPEMLPEIMAVEELIGRFPGWARLIAGLYRRNRDQTAALGALSDRLTHDPFLAESLHTMLSNITAIRSTAQILSSTEDLPDDQRRAFDRIVHEESRRLSDVAGALTDYFDRAGDADATPATPEEELDRFLDRHGHAFDLLDRAAMGAGEPATRIAEIVDGAAQLTSDAARRLAHGHLTDYAADAAAMPFAPFLEEATEGRYDLDRLAGRFDVPLAAVFRRLAVLRRPGVTAPAFGLVIANAAGAARLRRPLADFPLPRHGAACPRWPLFLALSQPGRPLRDWVAMPDGSRFLTVSLASPALPAGIGRHPVFETAMLFARAEDVADLALARDIPGASPAIAVGSNCRLCTRTDCGVRAEAAILGPAAAEPLPEPQP